MRTTRNVARFSGGLAALTMATMSPTLGVVQGVGSCFRATDVDFVGGCPCGVGSFKFALEGKINVENLTVNLAVVVDGSDSLSSAHFGLQKDFARRLVASLADENILFANGGTVSYVQVSDTVISSGTFTSTNAFDSFLETDLFSSGPSATKDVGAGVARARELLTASPSDAGFMVVLCAGGWSQASDVETEAYSASAKGIIFLSAVTGNGASGAGLAAVADYSENFFTVGNLNFLVEEALWAIIGELQNVADDALWCPSTGAVVTMDFNAPVIPAPSPAGTAFVAGNSVTFKVDDLESDPAEFVVLVDSCDVPHGAPVVASIAYRDDQGNLAELSNILRDAVFPECGAASPLSPGPCSCDGSTEIECDYCASTSRLLRENSRRRRRRTRRGRRKPPATIPAPFAPVTPSATPGLEAEDLVDARERTTVTQSADAYDTKTSSGGGCDPAGCSPDLSRDGDLDDGSRWSCSEQLGGSRCKITFEFEEPQDIVRLDIKFYKGDERVRTLELSDSEGFSKTITSSGGSDDFESFDVDTDETAWLTMEAVDLDSRDWISIIEVEFLVE